MNQVNSNTLELQELGQVVIRFAGDSGDGMQLTGNQFTRTAAQSGNDVMTLPDFPSEIRAPAGTVSGVSGFQIQFGNKVVNTPGDYPDVLIAMNPAALKVNIKDVKRDGFILLDRDAFTEKNIQKAGYTVDPLSDEALLNRMTYQAPITSQTLRALEGFDMPKKAKERCKNFFTLGILFWIYDQPSIHTEEWLKKKFAKKPSIAEANIKTLKEGMIYAQNASMFQAQFKVPQAPVKKGTYKSLTGNQATALGLIAASERAGLKMFLGSYPITPATDILHEIVKYKRFGVKTVQCEDEIAGICATLGGAYAGAFAVTTTSGPGVALKSEALGLAVITELPMVIVNVQRGGPSTGLPTKTEQADLLQAMYGRNGEAPIPIVAAKSPSDCFDQAIEASRLALKYMTPVFLLTDGYLGNGSEAFKIPRVEDLPDLTTTHRTDPENFKSYSRDPKTLARDWVKPGTPGMAHRIGSLEKDRETGCVSHDPENHNYMVRTRQAKVDGIANDIPELEIYGDQEGGDILIMGWGSTFGAIRNSVDKYRVEGKSVSQAHFTHLCPFPKNTLEVMKKFKTVVIAEMNLGQLHKMIQATYAHKAIALTKIQGKPFTEAEIAVVVDELL
ncbi:MAG: 2-oxoglutarate ferredoxin oxidoreductase subunit alpha [SAR324 cluster bacterium]|uniref:2-oxoglutarate ferredoxin oxidoreductase subunit alpha n=1 Tax=SAR324 cluster bacterium TaxID=2024889 RepID=A0A2A4SUR4_9DELT|nr:MAG: 2-oxoglutarate ferredoxin oxidoreductase subunit alpha [SAR324 cluster bacterium]